MGGVATIEPVNKVIVPVLLGIVVFSFYWAIFLPYASEGIQFMFQPNWGRYQPGVSWSIDILMINVCCVFSQPEVLQNLARCYLAECLGYR